MGRKARMPEIYFGAHLVTALWEIGPTDANGRPVPWSEIKAWSEMTRKRLSAWDSETLHQMSGEYAKWQAKCKTNAHCASPLDKSAAEDDVIAHLTKLSERNKKAAPIVEKAPMKTGKKKVRSG